MTPIGTRIRQSRIAAGLSQQELADRVGVSRAAVALWEIGDTKGLKAENLVATADALGVSIRWLATGKGSKEEHPSAHSATESTNDKADGLVVGLAGAFAAVEQILPHRRYPLTHEERAELILKLTQRLRQSGMMEMDELYEIVRPFREKYEAKKRRQKFKA